MDILVVAATEAERAALVLGASSDRGRIEVLVTGVGMVACASKVARALAVSRFDVAINIGVCGSFDRAFPLGSVVHVTTDRISELGVEDGPAFVPADAMGLAALEPPFAEGRLVNAAPPCSQVLDALPKVNGITVNTVHGDDASIASVVDRYQPQVESMEGAAFMYACLVAGMPFAQIRAVSNYVERRNRAAWKLPEAIASLGLIATAILDDMASRPHAPR